MSGNLGQRDDVTGADELTRIEAIGPRRAARLNAAGIRTYAGLASCSRDEIAAVLPDVSPAKIDAWRDEAGQLARAASTREAPGVPAGRREAPGVPAGRREAPGVPAGGREAPGVPAGPGVAAGPGGAAGPHIQAAPGVPAGPDVAAADGQRYESVLVRILLNEDGSVRRVTAQHIRTGAQRHWPTLEREALPDFIEAAIASAAPPAKSPSAETPAEAHDGRTSHAGTARQRPDRLRPVEVHGAQGGVQNARPRSSAVLSVERTPLRAAESFTVTMAIELAAPASHADRLAYSAVVVATSLTGGQKRTVAKSDGVLAATSSTISINAAGLSPGAYRLDGAISLRQPGADRPVDLAGIAEGLLVQVLPG